jgi:precorrin-2 dehydrogenase/sirohydrochlorin ferrochelatase
MRIFVRVQGAREPEKRSVLRLREHFQATEQRRNRTKSPFLEGYELLPDPASPDILLLMNTKLPAQRYYPLFLDLTGKKVVVVGGGNVAERKVAGLLDAGAMVIVVSPEVTPGLQDIASRELIGWKARPFVADDLDDAWLVIAATDDQSAQRIVHAEAERRGIFCNTVDQPDLCSFIVPSMVRRGDLCVAISTAGKSPALARRLRREFEQFFGPYYTPYVALLGELRQLILASFPDPETRKSRCLSLADPEVMTWLEEGEWDQVKDWAVALCGKDAASVVERYRNAPEEGPLSPTDEHKTPCR